jgi:hypothetical protein
MDYQPDWKSKLLVSTLGKKRAATLLDASELMFRDDFKSTKHYSVISDNILTAAIASNVGVVLTSLTTSRVFKQTRIFSPIKLLGDMVIIVAGYYIGAIWLAETIQSNVT